MTDIAKKRTLLATMHQIAIHLTEDEISDIGLILLRATQRMEKETKELNK